MRCSLGSRTSFDAACVASAWDQTPSLSAWVLTVFLGNRYRLEGITSLPWKDDGPLRDIIGKSQGRQSEEDEAMHFIRVES